MTADPIVENELEDNDVTEISTTEAHAAYAAATTPRVPYESKEIETGKLKIRPQYQRPLSDKRVEQMARNFDDNLAGTIEVSFADGFYWVVDGQHRLAAMRSKGIRVCRVLVHYGLTVEDEARLFAQLNSQRSVVLPRDLYRAELLAGVERSVAVQSSLTRHGLGISPKAGHDRRLIAAVGSLWELQSLGTLDATLDLIVGQWSDADGVPNHGALEGRVVVSIGRFIAVNREHPLFALKRLATALSRHTPAELVREAQTFSTWSRGSRGTLYRWYNYGLQTKLPEAK